VEQLVICRDNLSLLSRVRELNTASSKLVVNAKPCLNWHNCEADCSAINLLNLLSIIAFRSVHGDDTVMTAAALNSSALRVRVLALAYQVCYRLVKWFDEALLYTQITASLVL